MTKHRGLRLIENPESEFRQYLRLWLDAIALDHSPATLRVYRQVVERFVQYLEAQGIDTMDAVQPAHLREYLLQRKAQGLRPESLHKDYRHIRAYFRWCVKQELCEKDPTRKVPPPRVPFEPRPVLSPEEVKRILAACDGSGWIARRNKALVLTALDTGMRASELLRMQVADATKETLTITGKGQKTRFVFLSSETRVCIAQYLKRMPFPIRDEEQPLWWNRQRNPLQLDGLFEAIQQISRRAGIPFSVHTLRRTYVLWSLRSGCSLEHLRALLGHSSLATLRHYLNLQADDLREAHRQHSPVNLLAKRNR